MTTENLRTTLEIYRNTWAKAAKESGDLQTVDQFLGFIAKNPLCFHRSNLPGHLTGSALLVNPTLSKVMLTHHRKLEMWLQLGGHADGHPIIHEVALNEALEESGLNHLSFLKYETELFQVHTATPLPFDLDCHVIPANSKDPEHLHYDVRFIILANDETPPAISDESLDVRWFSLEEARTITSEVSMHRQFDKLEHIRQSLRIN